MHRPTDCEGHAIGYHVLGWGYQTVVLDAGFRNGFAAWNTIVASLRDQARMVVLDRSHISFVASNANPVLSSQPVDAIAQVQSIESPERPLVLAGWALGNAYVHAFASAFPNQVNGIVLVDPVPPAMLQWLVNGLDEISPESSQYCSELIADVDFVRRHHGLEAIILSPDPIPITIPQVHIFRGDQPAPDDVLGTRWVEFQRQRLAGAPNVREVIAGRSGQNIPGVRPDVIVDAVRDILVRTRD